MFQEDLNLLIKYPLIDCVEENGAKHFRGIIQLSSFRDVEFDVIEENSNGCVNYRVISTFGSGIDEELNKQEGINEIVGFIDRSKSILETCLVKNPIRNLSGTYKRLLYEYSEFTRFHLNIKTCSISPDLSCVDISTLDEAGREHKLHILMDYDQNRDIFKPIDVNLPEQFSKELTTNNSSNLTEVYDKFLATLDSLQLFFNIMDELDGCCSVLDPEKPTRSDCHRRIWLDQNMSVMLTIDPVYVNSRPDLKFLGPERLVEKYRRKLNEKLAVWDENANFVQNLLDILAIEAFPKRPEINREILMDTGECSICFSDRYNNNLPEIVCGNKSCENCYHTECLYEWLTSVNSKRIFNQIHGQCPNCEKAISCPLPELQPVA